MKPLHNTIKTIAGRSCVNDVMERVVLSINRGGTGISPDPGPRVLMYRTGTGSFQVLAHTKNGYRQKMILYNSRWLQLGGSNSFIIYAA